jgi:hypothetical protein
MSLRVGWVKLRQVALDLDQLIILHVSLTSNLTSSCQHVLREVAGVQERKETEKHFLKFLLALSLPLTYWPKQIK